MARSCCAARVICADPGHQANAVVSFSSARRFQMWEYTVSMSMHLIRSARSSEYSSQIDVLFQAVKCVRLPITFVGLSFSHVREARLELDLPEVVRARQHSTPRRITYQDATGHSSLAAHSPLKRPTTLTNAVRCCRTRNST
jgi:hypothetical protein